MKSKKKAGLWIAVLCILSLSACSGEKKSNRPIMNINTFQGEDGTTYVKRDGTEKQYFQVEEDNFCDVSIKVNKVEGKLNMSIKKDGAQDTIYAGNDLPSSEFVVHADEKGQYTILIEADEFVGDYSCNFSTIQ